MIRWLPLALSIAAAAAAQPPPTPFRSGIEIVELDVSVTRGGSPVQGLTARDFVLTDNGVAQTVDSVTLDRVPLSVTLLLDTSTSVLGERLAHLKQAGNGIVDALTADDRASLITFSHNVDVAVGMTFDKDALRRALASIKARPVVTHARPLAATCADLYRWRRHDQLDQRRRDPRHRPPLRDRDSCDPLAVEPFPGSAH